MRRVCDKLILSPYGASPPRKGGMNNLFLICTLTLPAVITWLAGRALSRLNPTWRHLPWIALTALGGGLLWLSRGQDPGSTMGSGFAFASQWLLGVLLTAGGVIAGALTWWCPPPSHRRTGPTHPHHAAVNTGTPPPTEKPPTFALLRQHIEPELPLPALIDAARSVTSIQEADCRRIPPHAGILFQGLDKADALRLRDALNAQNLPVHLVEESRLFSLPLGRRAQALRLERDALVETDCVGREHRHPLPQVQWCGAGRLQEVVYREKNKTKKRVVHSASGHARVETYHEKERGMADLASLRVEFLTSRDPWRIIWTCDGEQRRLLQNRPVGPGDPEPFESFVRDLRGRISPERLNPSIRQLDNGPLWVYPSLKTFEEEIRWTLTRRKTTTSETHP